MGGCRCVYRRCQNSTAVSPGLHYFHFPVRDPPRCDQWIENALKPEFRMLEKDKLRNKVVCSLHFENKCFTNEKQDRLIHSAVPTLGFEDDILGVNDPLLTQMSDDNFMLIPIDEENTKFAIPNAEFAGMSYTIFDDAVIPTSKIEEVIIRELQNNPSQKVKELQLKSVVKKIKTTLPPPLKRMPVNRTNQQQDISQFSVFKNENNQQTRTEVKIVNTSIERSNNNIPSYSVSTLNGDVSVEPSTHILPDIMTETEIQIPDFPLIPPQQENTDSLENISLQMRHENEYTMSVTPVSLIQNLSHNENSHDSLTDYQHQHQQPLTDYQHQHQQPIISSEFEQNMDQTVVETNDNICQKVEIETNEQQPEKTIKTEYVQMIKSNTKQIKQLKRLLQKQNKYNRMVWQRKQMPHFKPKRLSKIELLETLKDSVKPSLLAILKLELLPVEEIVLSDQEEKFITDLYTQHPECYNLLRTKFNWNLPFSEKMEDAVVLSD